MGYVILGMVLLAIIFGGLSIWNHYRAYRTVKKYIKERNKMRTKWSKLAQIIEGNMKK